MGPQFEVLNFYQKSYKCNNTYKGSAPHQNFISQNQFKQIYYLFINSILNPLPTFYKCLQIFLNITSLQVLQEIMVFLFILGLLNYFISFLAISQYSVNYVNYHFNVKLVNHPIINTEMVNDHFVNYVIKSQKVLIVKTLVMKHHILNIWYKNIKIQQKTLVFVMSQNGINFMKGLEKYNQEKIPQSYIPSLTDRQSYVERQFFGVLDKNTVLFLNYQSLIQSKFSKDQEQCVQDCRIHKFEYSNLQIVFKVISNVQLIKVRVLIFKLKKKLVNNIVVEAGYFDDDRKDEFLGTSQMFLLLHMRSLQDQSSAIYVV
ncbi:unnamed protein product [Paramecium sonneborni]|uniref:Transmembrane protein n=1 Tax=Paramecium sonneborni TaxID=65129 RepID=A0A8S1RMH5_9CILI|nr:unnamed protein product [Paramecium sonneborni]